MKNFASLSAFLFSCSILMAQVAPPEAINYSGVARDGSGVELVSTTIGLQLSILETTATGNMVYQEDHITTTDDFGRFSVALGTGAVQTGSFPTIDWGGDSHFLQVGLDEIGGNSYTTMGTTQMLSVPYALYAKQAGTVNGLGSITISQMGDTLFNGTDTLIIPGISTANGGNSYYMPGGGVTDIDGNQYVSVVMANGQEWMADNLRTTKYANGDDIPNVTDGADWSNLSTGAWCWYDNDNIYDIPRGKLYNGFAIADTRNVCPSGWHIPGLDEIKLLVTLLGGVSVAGGKMKYPGPWWCDPSMDATNESGFSVFPNGQRVNGAFQNLSNFAAFWGSGSYTNCFGQNWMVGMRLTSEDGSIVPSMTNSQSTGASIRCIKD